MQHANNRVWMNKRHTEPMLVAMYAWFFLIFAVEAGWVLDTSCRPLVVACRGFPRIVMTWFISCCLWQGSLVPSARMFIPRHAHQI